MIGTRSVTEWIRAHALAESGADPVRFPEAVERARAYTGWGRYDYFLPPDLRALADRVMIISGWRRARIGLFRSRDAYERLAEGCYLRATKHDDLMALVDAVNYFRIAATMGLAFALVRMWLQRSVTLYLYRTWTPIAGMTDRDRLPAVTYADRQYHCAGCDLTTDRDECPRCGSTLPELV